MSEAVKELLVLSGETTLARAALKLGIFDRQAAEVTVCDEEEWQRGGAETYILRFRIVTPNESRHLLFKACVAFPGSGAIDTVLARWIERRKLLQANGVSTPKFYGHNQGTLLEENIPHSLLDVLAKGGRERQTLLAALGNTVGVIDRLGFLSLDGPADFRSRGDDVVVVDFGQDLGSPGQQNNLTNELSRLDKIVQGLRTIETDLDYAILQNSYLKAIGRPLS